MATASFATKDDIELAIADFATAKLADLATKSEVQGAVDEFAAEVNTTLARAQSFSDLRAGIPFRNLDIGP